MCFQLTAAEKASVREFLTDLRAGRAWVSASKLEAAYEDYAHKALSLRSTEGQAGAYRAMKAVGLLRGMTAGAVDGEMRVRRKAWKAQRLKEQEENLQRWHEKQDECWTKRMSEIASRQAKAT